jgi:hypothetical protein
VAVNLDELDLRERAARPAHKADVDGGVLELSYDRRLAVAARRVADLFDQVSMFSTASCCASWLRPATSR